MPPTRRPDNKAANQCPHTPCEVARSHPYSPSHIATVASLMSGYVLATHNGAATGACKDARTPAGGLLFGDSLGNALGC